MDNQTVGQIQLQQPVVWSNGKTIGMLIWSIFCSNFIGTILCIIALVFGREIQKFAAIGDHATASIRCDTVKQLTKISLILNIVFTCFVMLYMLFMVVWVAFVFYAASGAMNFPVM